MPHTMLGTRKIKLEEKLLPWGARSQLGYTEDNAQLLYERCVPLEGGEVVNSRPAVTEEISESLAQSFGTHFPMLSWCSTLFGSWLFHQEIHLGSGWRQARQQPQRYPNLPLFFSPDHSQICSPFLVVVQEKCAWKNHVPLNTHTITYPFHSSIHSSIHSPIRPSNHPEPFNPPTCQSRTKLWAQKHMGHEPVFTHGLWVD